MWKQYNFDFVNICIFNTVIVTTSFVHIADISLMLEPLKGSYDCLWLHLKLSCMVNKMAFNVLLVCTNHPACDTSKQANKKIDFTVDLTWWPGAR